MKRFRKDLKLRVPIITDDILYGYDKPDYDINEMKKYFIRLDLDWPYETNLAPENIDLRYCPICKASHYLASNHYKYGKYTPICCNYCKQKVNITWAEHCRSKSHKSKIWNFI